MAGPTAIITACAHEAALVRRQLRVQQQATSTAGLVWQGVLHHQTCVAAVRYGAGTCRAGRPLVGSTLPAIWGAQRWFCRWIAGRTEARSCSSGHVYTRPGGCGLPFELRGGQGHTTRRKTGTHRGHGRGASRRGESHGNAAQYHGCGGAGRRQARAWAAIRSAGGRHGVV